MNRDVLHFYRQLEAARVVCFVYSPMNCVRCTFVYSYTIVYDVGGR